MRSLATLARGNRVPVVVLAGTVVVVVLSLLGVLDDRGDVPSFEAQACGIERSWLVRTQRGYFEPRSGQISLLPKFPAYMASGAGGWSHSGPWPYLQDIPLVFYGPGFVPAYADVDEPATTADVAPTLLKFMRGFYRADGAALDEIAQFTGRSLERPPKLIVVVVWDGGGWNTLRQWPDDWPNLKRLMAAGTSFTDATVGSSPSVTPAVHTTLGTGYFPSTHGITGVPMRDENGEVVDAFLKGESSRFIQVPTLAERWDEQNGNKAKVGMLGYEPWHLGMIGKGAEKEGGDKDDAVWLDIETNEWITNPDHYRLPPAIEETGGLDEDLEALDAADGSADDSWRGEVDLDDVTRWEETPAFVKFHTRALMNLIEQDGYGEDHITDLLFTNYKQIDRVGHYFNMKSEFVHDALIESDKQLGELVAFLDEEVGDRGYVVVVTADHGQQPDATAVDGYGIDPREIESDIDAEFGAITRAVWPTEVFLLEDEMEERGVTVEDVASFLGDYRLVDNTQRPDMVVGGQGQFGPSSRLFDMAIPARMLPGLACGGSAGRP